MVVIISRSPGIQEVNFVDLSYTVEPIKERHTPTKGLEEV